MSTADDSPPAGRYLAHDVGRLAGVSGTTVGQWARRGYIRSSHSDHVPRVYSFQDVAEAIVVHELLDARLSHREVRRATDALRADYGDWPLHHAELALAARSLVVRREGRHFALGERPWHEVLEVGDLSRISHELGRGGWVVRDLPDLRHVEVTPDRLGGRPVVRGRRLAAEDVAELAEAGVSGLEEGYGLDPEQVADARRWWRAVRALEAG